ncbi:hypothetical protein QZM91_26885 [Burkholderia multivorans]|nr:hypothetical protein [Burkholderia multivorans]
MNEARHTARYGKTGQIDAMSNPIVTPPRPILIVISGPTGDKTGHALQRRRLKIGDGPRAPARANAQGSRL